MCLKETKKQKKERNDETTNIKRQINEETVKQRILNVKQMAERLKERLTNKQQTHTKR